MTTENKPYFSFEVLPPLRGKGIDSIYRTIDRLMPFDPAYINITTHRYDTLYSELANGTYKKLSVLNRPGTVAIAAAIKERYKVRTVPHIICSGDRERTDRPLLSGYNRPAAAKRRQSQKRQQIHSNA